VKNNINICKRRHQLCSSYNTVNRSLPLSRFVSPRIMARNGHTILNHTYSTIRSSVKTEVESETKTQGEKLEKIINAEGDAHEAQGTTIIPVTKFRNVLCQNILHDNHCFDKNCKMEHDIEKYFDNNNYKFQYVSVEQPMANFCSIKHFRTQISHLFSSGTVGEDFAWILADEDNKQITDLGFQLVKEEDVAFDIFSNYSIKNFEKQTINIIASGYTAVVYGADANSIDKLSHNIVLLGELLLLKYPQSKTNILYNTSIYLPRSVLTDSSGSHNTNSRNRRKQIKLKLNEKNAYSNGDYVKYYQDQNTYNNVDHHKVSVPVGTDHIKIFMRPYDDINDKTPWPAFVSFMLRLKPHKVQSIVNGPFVEKSLSLIDILNYDIETASILFSDFQDANESEQAFLIYGTNDEDITLLYNRLYETYNKFAKIPQLYQENEIHYDKIFDIFTKSGIYNVSQNTDLHNVICPEFSEYGKCLIPPDIDKKCFDRKCPYNHDVSKLKISPNLKLVQIKPMDKSQWNKMKRTFNDEAIRISKQFNNKVIIQPHYSSNEPLFSLHAKDTIILEQAYKTFSNFVKSKDSNRPFCPSILKNGVCNTKENCTFSHWLDDIKGEKEIMPLKFGMYHAMGQKEYRHLIISKLKEILQSKNIDVLYIADVESDSNNMTNLFVPEKKKKKKQRKNVRRNWRITDRKEAVLVFYGDDVNEENMNIMKKTVTDLAQKFKTKMFPQKTFYCSSSLLNELPDEIKFTNDYVLSKQRTRDNNGISLISISAMDTDGLELGVEALEGVTCTTTVPLEEGSNAHVYLTKDQKHFDKLVQQYNSKIKDSSNNFLCLRLNEAKTEARIITTCESHGQQFKAFLCNEYLDKLEERSIYLPKWFKRGRSRMHDVKYLYNVYKEDPAYDNIRLSQIANHFDCSVLKLVGKKEDLDFAEKRALNVYNAQSFQENYSDLILKFVPLEALGFVIGPKGINIKGIQRESGTEIMMPVSLSVKFEDESPVFVLDESIKHGRQHHYAVDSSAEYKPVYIRGTKDTVQIACSMLDSLISSHRERKINASNRQKGKGNKKKQLTQRQAHFATLRKRAGEKILISREEVQLGVLAGIMRLSEEMLAKTLSDMGEPGYNSDTLVPSDIAELLIMESGMIPIFREEGHLDRKRSDRVVNDRTPTRPAVVTIMGHVDHGKTTLLDTLRQSAIGSSESGGITQKIGGFTLKSQSGTNLTFIDTPGHAAFSFMRETGANASDINIVVVAAEDGIMPQTVEALNIARVSLEKNNAPLIVAMTKIDKGDLDIERSIRDIESQLLENGIVTENMGGDVQVIPLSAVSGEGLDDFVDAVSLHAELLELKSNPKDPGEGIVLESSFERGSGIVADLLVQWGTLKKNNYVVVGEEWGRIKRIKDDHGKMLKSAGAGVPVQVTGFRGPPTSGEDFFVVDNERQCVAIAEHRAELRRRGSLAQMRLRQQDDEYNDAMNKSTLRRAVKDKERQDNIEEDAEENKLNIILKADSTGTLVALEKCFSEVVEKYNGSVNVFVAMTGTGDITATDIYAAGDSGAIIYAFNSKIAKDASALAQQHGVEVVHHKIIYRLEDDLDEKITDMIPKVESESLSGRAEVLDTFEINGPSRGIKYQINGMKVTSGTIKKDQFYRVIRDDELIYDNLQVKTMKIFKDDAKQVGNGGECGIQLVPKSTTTTEATYTEDADDNMQDKGLYGIKLIPGDVVESYSIAMVPKQL
jgi:translation initiation factor IF-2